MIEQQTLFDTVKGWEQGHKHNKRGKIASTPSRTTNNRTSLILQHRDADSKGFGVLFMNGAVS